MKNALIWVACLLIFSVAATYSPGQVASSPSPDQWLQDKYREATSIKAGMSREDLLKVFMEDGGLNTIPATRYVLRSCHLIKVEVAFNTEYGQAYKEKPDRELKIGRISKPYLENMFID
jgi:hypothetical protein